MLKLFKSQHQARQTKKILVVDDEPDLVDTIKRRLEYNKWEVVTAADGQEAVDKASSDKPDLILLDIRMPLMNGHEALRHLRADPALHDIPVIMLTASSEPSDIAAASCHNIAHYTTKPFDFTDLVKKIEETLAL